MKKKIFWLVGQQQAGKTMLATVFKSYGAQVIHIGEELRKYYSVKEFAEAGNPHAPDFTEQVAQELILNALAEFKISTVPFLVIDSAPRSMEQLNILHSDTGEFTESTILFITENYEVRKNRSRTKYKGDISFFEKREIHERHWLELLHGLCKVRNVDYIFFKRPDWYRE